MNVVHVSIAQMGLINENTATIATHLLVNDDLCRRALYRGPMANRKQIYAIKKQEHFDADITVNNDTMQITVKAGFFSKTMTWTRIK